METRKAQAGENRFKVLRHRLFQQSDRLKPLTCDLRGSLQYMRSQGRTKPKILSKIMFPTRVVLYNVARMNIRLEIMRRIDIPAEMFENTKAPEACRATCAYDVLT